MMLFASTAATTGCVVRADPLTDPAGEVVKISLVATTSEVTLFASVVGRLDPTPS